MKRHRAYEKPSERKTRENGGGGWDGDPFKILPDDTAALRRCCRAFAHTVDQGGSEQVAAVGNSSGGGPAQRLVVLGPYAQTLLFQPFLIGNRLLLLHISP